MNQSIKSHGFVRLFLIRITIALLSILILICYTTLPINAQNSAEEHFYSGVEKANSGDCQGAIKEFDKAIKLNPKLAEAYSNNRGAIEDYNKAIEINPKLAEAYYNRGLAKLFLSKKDSGCLDLSKAGELGYSEAYEAIKEFCNP